MVKALSFKGDKPLKKKRRRTEDPRETGTANTKQLATTDGAPEDEENWVSADSISDIAGPVMLVLASTKPVKCLSVDQLGAVFPQKVENLIEDEPFTAEPHDVRQVWIANRVVGMEKDFTFKGHHGKYLACSAIGELSAAREAVSPEETFRLEETEGTAGARRTFMVKTWKDKFLTGKDGELRGDADDDTEDAKVYIRMQARFKPKHKAEKAERTAAKISRKEIEAEAGRRLEDDEVKKLKKARKEGNYHEAMLDVKVKGKHDKFA